MIPFFHTLFYSSIVWISSILPGQKVGFALVLWGILTFFFSWIVRKWHIHHRIRHQLFARAKKQNYRSITEILFDTAHLPWKGIGSSLALALFFLIFLIGTIFAVNTSPGDMRYVFFSLSFIPAGLDYNFFGWNIAETGYSYMITFFFGFLLFVQQFLVMIPRWKEEQNLKKNHAFELFFLLFMIQIFIVLSRNFAFGVMLFWITYLICVLLYELYLHPQYMVKLEENMKQYSDFLLQEKKEHFAALHSKFHHFLARGIMHRENIHLHEALLQIQHNAQHVNFHEYFSVIRYQIIASPLFFILCGLAIFFTLWK